MDYLIITIGASTFVLFLVSLCIAFRIVHQYDAVLWLVRLSVVWAFVCMTTWVSIMGFSLYAFVPLLVYGLLVLLFSFGIFGVFEASITVHILSIVASAGRSGIHPNAILGSYNRHSIVKRRIDRLVHSGEIIIRGNQFRSGRRLSYFTIREYLLHMLHSVYPQP